MLKNIAIIIPQIPEGAHLEVQLKENDVLVRFSVNPSKLAKGKERKTSQGVRSGEKAKPWEKPQLS